MELGRIYNGKLKQLNEERKMKVGNTIIEIPQDGRYVSMLYFNYEQPCDNPVKCRDFVCNNFYDGIFPNTFAIKLPNKDYKVDPFQPLDKKGKRIL